jgi:hypothetical protein
VLHCCCVNILIRRKLVADLGRELVVGDWVAEEVVRGCGETGGDCFTPSDAVKSKLV